MKVDTYLTEELLGRILVQWAGAENVTQQPRVTGTRMRSDYEVRKSGITYIVEFEGDSHYRDANVVQRDIIKYSLQTAEGKRVVKIPYFVQLDSNTFEHFFGESFEIETTFPHGFITTKILPASFCPVGYHSARVIYDELPHSVKEAIIASLEEKAKSLPSHFVFYTTDYDGRTWEEFLVKAREVHGDKYTYLRNL